VIVVRIRKPARVWYLTGTYYSWRRRDRGFMSSWSWETQRFHAARRRAAIKGPSTQLQLKLQ
jgi:hypothetical protein